MNSTERKLGELKEAMEVHKTAKSTVSVARSIISGVRDRPEVLTEEHIERISRKFDMVTASSTDIAKSFFVDSWEEIEAVSKEEGLLILGALRDKHYKLNDAFKRNLEFYLAKGVVTKNFTHIQVYSNRKYNLETVLGLWGSTSKCCLTG